MELNKLYFFTASVTRWINLFERESFKEIIVDSLNYLVRNNKLEVYGFVIMPNHIHLIWELLSKNGKENPHASFMKFVSHEIQKELRISDPGFLETFKVDSVSRKYHFWQRDPLAIELYSPHVIHQKLDYIHNNPCQGKWMLADSPLDYKYSSALFYETGDSNFSFLRHVGEKI